MVCWKAYFLNFEKIEIFIKGGSTKVPQTVRFERIVFDALAHGRIATCEMTLSIGWICGTFAEPSEYNLRNYEIMKNNLSNKPKIIEIEQVLRKLSMFEANHDFRSMAEKYSRYVP